MSRFVVAIADNAFAPVDVERELLATIDAEVRFGSALDEDAVLELAAGADAILCDAAPISRRVLAELPTVRVVAEYGVGYDNIDVAAASDLGVWVSNVPGFCTEEVAEHTLALVLALARRITALDDIVRSGRWGANAAGKIRRLAGQTLGVVGFGPIGQTVARKAGGLGMHVLAYSRGMTAERAAAHGARAVGLDELLSGSDFVSLHLPATAETRGLIDAAALARMQPSAFLVNVGRGALVDEGALIAALQGGQIAGAALDVFATEPVDSTNALLRLPNVILTPHAAFYSEESLRALQDGATRNVIAVLRGGVPETPVNRVGAPRRPG